MTSIYDKPVVGKSKALRQAKIDHGHKSRGEKIEALARELGECTPGCAHCHAVASELLEQAEKEDNALNRDNWPTHKETAP